MSAPRTLHGPQAEQLRSAFALLQAGENGQALALARSLAAQAAWSADAQQLLAMCLAASGESEAAAATFERALALAPGHPTILSNYALALRRSGRAWAALEMSRRAAAAAPSSKAFVDLAVAAQAAGAHGEALAASGRALAARPDSQAAMLCVGNAARMTEDLARADEAYRGILRQQPAHRQAWLGLGDAQRRAGRPDLALATLERARAHGVSGADLGDAVVGALVDAGRVDDALALAGAQVRAHPDFVPGWITLADLAWEYADPGVGEACLEAFRQAAAAREDLPALAMAYARFMLSIHRPGEALAWFARLRDAGANPGLLLAEAEALDRLGRPAEAAVRYERLQRMGWDSEPSFLNACARHFLHAGDPDAAQAAAQAATRIDPCNQQAWAYLSTAWRLSGDAREWWLCDCERLVGLVEVEPPPGFAGMPEFLDALDRVLDPMHGARREPVRQSLRGGSQTPGRLFGRGVPLLEDVRRAMSRAIEPWLAALPADGRHPFLSRRRRAVRIGGSWSVKLWSAGSHANHIHDEGWMSSAFYVSLPPCVGEGGPAGAIQFGQPPLELGLELAPRRVVVPRPGMLALFPSYLWHGTIPFHDALPRVTIAFDMTPLEPAA